MAFSEARRQVVHMSVGGFALLLRWLTWWQAALVATAAVAFNVVVLPRIAGTLFRPRDTLSIAGDGIAIYPLAVLGLILCFPSRPDIVAGAWAILAVGDGAATLVGTHASSPALAWNRAKSTAGLLACIAGGAAAAAALMAWTRPAAGNPPIWFALVAGPMAAVMAGFAETLPIRLDDNITVPVTAALALWGLSRIDPGTLASARPAVAARLVPALLANLAVATAGWLARTVTPGGAITGAAIGVATWLGAGVAGWSMLIVAFVTAAVATRVGRERKVLLGIAEARGGRRGPGNALANTGLAAGAALLSLGVGNVLGARIVLVAALATAASDTVASEVGKAWGRTTWLLTTFHRVPPGTSGAVSVEGTIAGGVAAIALASVGVVLRLVPPVAAGAIALAAILASLLEGALGATLEARGTLDNDTLNFINTAVGAALALAMVKLISYS